ncbi:hypothetical protein LPJ66_004548 [Kickxella alabastrina]|uniref:Uncharacterized protein n=1 Tax=Kickxella alabastrina TaxID=61397 RepID=A0ACC1IID9_9FUNG|nr:hypothetical protein LPJ66_004548 [Kickxella alabastrina]
MSHLSSTGLSNTSRCKRSSLAGAHSMEGAALAKDSPLSGTLIADLGADAHTYGGQRAQPFILTRGSSDEGDVQISLGIQTGIERVWRAALERVGSLSLAWHDEAAQARGDVGAAMDLSLVFDSAAPVAPHAAGRARDHRETTLRSLAIDGGSGNNTVRSEESPGLRTRRLDGHREATLHSTAIDSGSSHSGSNSPATETRWAGAGTGGARGRRRRPVVQQAKHVREAIPPALTLVVTAAPEKTSPHVRLVVPEAAVDAELTQPRRAQHTSIRLQRLLPPKTPEPLQKPQSVWPPLPARKYSDAGASTAGGRSHPVESIFEPSPAIAHRRASSLPHGTVSSGIGIVANTSPLLGHRPNLGLQGATLDLQEGPVRGDRCLTSLEEQVSEMFIELGLSSPYTDKGQIANDRLCVPGGNDGAAGISIQHNSGSRTGRHYHGMATVPWFHQAQYTEPGLEEPAPERDVVLVDDDSSCADNIVDADCLHRGPLYLTGVGAVHGGPGSHARRIPAATGNKHNAASSAASAKCDYSQHHSSFRPRAHAVGSHWHANPREYYDGSGAAFFAANQCSVCHDLKMPCSQMHSIIARIEQTNQYVHSIGRHASAVDVLLADLRTQSRALAEILSISQTRASALGHTINRSINSTQLAAGDDGCCVGDACSAHGSPQTNQAHINDHHSLSRKTRDLHKRVQLLETQACASSTLPDPGHASLVSDIEYNRCYTLLRGSDEKMAKNDTSAQLRSSPRSSRQDHQAGSSRHRRPEQPLAVRVRRIDKQWSKLRSVIGQLRIGHVSDAVAKNAAGETLTALGATPNAVAAAAIAADGLKLIQRVLKSTLESLDAANGQCQVANNAQ